MGVMISCKEATLMIEKNHERPIGIADNVKLAYHLAICKACSLYRKQSKVIEKVLKYKAESVLSPEEVSTFKKHLKDKLSGSK